jgi:hypothetical protein
MVISVKDNGIYRDVPGGLIIVPTINVRQPSLQPMITILNKKHALGERLEVKVDKQKYSNLSFSNIHY